MLLMAALVRLFPMPNEADIIADDLALFSSGTLVAIAFAYLSLRRR
jgi:hypothetical protein